MDFHLHWLVDNIGKSIKANGAYSPFRLFLMTFQSIKFNSDRNVSGIDTAAFYHLSQFKRKVFLIEYICYPSGFYNKQKNELRLYYNPYCILYFPILSNRTGSDKDSIHCEFSDTTIPQPIYPLPPLSLSNSV